MAGESIVITVADSYNARIDSYNCLGQLYVMSIFEAVFSRVHAAAQVKNVRVRLAENLKTENRKDKLIRGT